MIEVTAAIDGEGPNLRSQICAARSMGSNGNSSGLPTGTTVWARQPGHCFGGLSSSSAAWNGSRVPSATWPASSSSRLAASRPRSAAKASAASSSRARACRRCLSSPLSLSQDQCWFSRLTSSWIPSLLTATVETMGGLLHPDPVAEQRAAGKRRGGIDREHGYRTAGRAERADQRAGHGGLTHPGRTGQADDPGPAGGRQEILDDRTDGRRLVLDKR